MCIKRELKHLSTFLKKSKEKALVVVSELALRKQMVFVIDENKLNLLTIKGESPVVL